MTNQSLHTAVMAGAGTGKTYSLVENYLCALFGLNGLSKKRPSEILALTFTQKAAHEMRLRITKRLSEFLLSTSDPLMELAEKEGVMLPDAEEIKRLLRALPNAPIATFHSFCADLLRKEAQAIGLDDNFEILTPNEEQELARNILRPIILQEIKKAKTPLKAMVARFRLGNGFTFGLVDGLLKLYFKLFEKGIEPKDLLNTIKDRRAVNIASLKGIKKAWADFYLTNISQKTKERLNQVSLAIDALEAYLEPFNEVQVNRHFALLRKSVGGNFGDALARQALVKEVVSFGALIVDLQSLGDEICLSEILVQFHEQFEQSKKSQGSISYSDLLTMTKKALLLDLDLRARAKKTIKHLLIDEYQDTSPLQEDIISLLLEDKNGSQIVADGKLLQKVSFLNGPSLFVVGDKKQSIYGFRGADISLFDAMVEKMAQTHKETGQFSKRFLTTNRRSKKSILSLVNLVALHTLRDQGYDLEQALVPNTLDEGQASLWVNEDDGAHKSNANLICAAFGISKLLEKGRKACDVVILVRRIKAASILKEHLQALGISSRIVGGEGFFKAQEIVDLLCFLRLINHPGDSLALAIVLRSPLVLLSEQQILLIANYGGITVPNAIEAFNSGKLGECPRLQKLFLLLEKLKVTIGIKGLSDSLEIIIKETDYAYALGLMDNHEQKWANVEKLSSMFLKNHKNPFSVIDEYYGHIFNETKEPQALGEIDEDAVTIMTIHQSKGLEFKVVVIADGESLNITNYDDFLVDKRLGLCLKPKTMASCAPDGQDKLLAQTRYDQCKNDLKAAEELEMARLLYVALTRAKEELYVACSKEAFENHKPKTLVGLFLKSLYNDKEQFLKSCSIEVINQPTHYQKALMTPLDVEIFSYPKVVKRIFASSLESSTKEISRLIRKYPNGHRKLINGDHAHKLLSLAGPASFVQNFDDGMIDNLLSAISRSQSILYDLDTAQAVKITLQVLNKALLGYEKAIFELPLFCDAHVMIEGFADLVVEFAEFIGVIEFKSSLRLVHEPNTYLQILAYAHALSPLKPVKFSVVLVGSHEELLWQDYDEKTRNLFLSEIKNIQK